jgi:hypothetical protein
MELCGYVATVGNSNSDLKKLVVSKGPDHGYVTDTSVDENGILDIFDHYRLSK